MNDLGTITLETERLILRKFKLEDAESMYNKDIRALSVYKPIIITPAK